ncbi:efflux RND transporter periplasmic adaptor subunit, partial [Aurantiacibacter xanthus]
MDQGRLLPLAALIALVALPGCSDDAPADAVVEAVPAAEAPTIETATAEATSSQPLGTVPGTVTLPPEARVAVTAPFPGAAVRVLVIEGQGVSRGQPLAIVRAAEP